MRVTEERSLFQKRSRTRRSSCSIPAPAAVSQLLWVLMTADMVSAHARAIGRCCIQAATLLKSQSQPIRLADMLKGRRPMKVKNHAAIITGGGSGMGAE